MTAAPPDELMRLYRAWKRASYDTPVVLSSQSTDYVALDEARAIARLGRGAVPGLMALLESDPDAHPLVHLLPEMTGHRLSDDDLAAGAARYGTPLGNQGLVRTWRDWWNAR